jgi:hypothetical protein
MSQRFAVVLIEVDQRAVRTFGLYPTADQAEAARRRIYFDAQKDVGVHQRFPARMPHTYVTEIEAES